MTEFLTQSLFVFLMCWLVWIGGDWLLTGLTYLSGCVDEPKRVPRYDSANVDE